MYLLRLSGTPRIEGPEGPIHGRVVQRRRMAVLAVLALAEGRSRSRDALVALLWPDLDSDRARHALADCVWVVRQALGAGAIRAVGDDLVLDPAMVATDVDRFMAAIASDDVEDAIQWCPEPLMDGFFVGGSPEFEHWLDRERQRLTTTLCAALEDRIDTCQRTADTRGAVRWARYLQALDPLNSGHVAMLAGALRDAGDRAGALRVVRDHARRLELDLSLPLDVRLVALLDELRQPAAAPPHGVPRVPRAVPVHDGVRPRERVSPSATDEGGNAADGTSRSPRLRPDVRRLTIGVVTGGVLAAALLPDRQPVAPIFHDRVLVRPLLNQTADSSLTLQGRWIATHAVEALVRADIADVVPGDLAGSSGGVGIEPDTATQAAGIVVEGWIRPGPDGPEVGGVVLIRPGRRAFASIGPLALDDEGVAAAEFGARVAGSVASYLGNLEPSQPLVVRAPSLAAYRMADRATRAFLRLDHDTAAALFHRAFELDTTAFGYLLWEGIAQSNRSRWSEVDAILTRLAGRRSDLAPLDQDHFDWLRATLDGDQSKRLAAARRAHQRYPQLGLGGFQLGQELMRSGRVREAVDVLASLDAGRGWLAQWRPYWSNLAAAHHLAGDHVAELGVADEGFRRNPGPATWRARIRARAALGRWPELRTLIATSGSAVDDCLTAAEALHRHGFHSLSVEAAEAGVAFLDREDGRDGASDASRYVRARLLILAGRPSEARPLLRGLLERRPESRDVLGWLGVASARTGDTVEARAMVDRLHALEGRPWSHGGFLVAQGVVRSELGDDPAAIRALLERAFREGWALPFYHFTTLFEDVRDSPEAKPFFDRATGD